MQIDMHYFGTYSMARAAGFDADTARTIATSAEYVDDSDRLDVTCKDNFQIRAEPTAHHPTNFKDNTDPEDQRRTWVPFHFIPGNQGSSLDERLICTTDSAIARAIVSNTLNNLEHTFSIPLLGILAHSFVDTFSHYGFSGISSPLNKIDGSTIKLSVSRDQSELKGRLAAFFARYAVGPLANFLVRLGHGSVATYPDQPYLKWEFMYVDPRRPSGLRDNQATFLAGCRRLHEIFEEARKRYHGDYDDLAASREFAAMAPAIREILACEGDAEERIKAWQKAATSGQLYNQKEAIPPYDSSMFTRDLAKLSEYTKATAKRTLVYSFLEAADFHRDYVLNDLLPKNGINIQSAKIEWHSA